MKMRSSSVIFVALVASVLALSFAASSTAAATAAPSVAAPLTPEQHAAFMNSAAGPTPMNDAAWFSACVPQSFAHLVSSRSAQSQGQPTWLPTVQRNEEGKHVHTEWSSNAQQQEEQTASASPLSTPLAVPSRSPKVACAYSPSYRAAHEEQCAAVDAAAEPISEADAPRSDPTPAPFPALDFQLVEGRNHSCAAWGWFSDRLHEDGWSYLYVHSNSELDDATQARAAGFLEGALSYRHIYDHKLNQFNGMFDGSPLVSGPDTLSLAWIRDQAAFVLKQVDEATKDPNAPLANYWAHQGLVLQQLQGVHAGYAAANPVPSRQLSYEELYWLNFAGDFDDIQAAANWTAAVTYSDPLPDVLTLLENNGHCSALIRVTDSELLPPAQQVQEQEQSTSEEGVRARGPGKELFAAHVTWASYAFMNRMYKAYRLPFGNNVSATAVTMSSFPGIVSSVDDWYQTLESRLIITETTNDIVNNTVYAAVDTASVPSWMRAMTATRLAQDGKQWTELFGEFNSGTYNNQWMIVDYKLFTSGSTIKPDTLWITEQMPGAMYSKDVSQILNDQGYWSSFNRPWFPAVYDAFGYNWLNSTYGSYLFGYEGYFRAQIFAREAPHVHDLSGMQHTMRLNDWESDPWSRNNSGWALSARWDLSVTEDPVPFLGWMGRGLHGGIDTKISSDAWMVNNLNESSGGSWSDPDILRVSIINGPTTQGSENPPFTWSDPEWTNATWHVGLPDTFDFPFVQFALTSFTTPECHCNAAQTCKHSSDGRSTSCVPSTKLIVGVVLGSVFGLALLVGCIMGWRRRRSDRLARQGAHVTNQPYGAADFAYQQQA